MTNSSERAMNVLYNNKPHGKESIEVRISQNKGKESENSYQKSKRSLWFLVRVFTFFSLILLYNNINNNNNIIKYTVILHTYIYIHTHYI